VEQDEAKRLFLLAVEAYERENFSEALGYYEQLSVDFPRHKDVFHEQIRCLIALGRYRKARELCHFLGKDLGDFRANILTAEIDVYDGPARTIDLGVSRTKRFFRDVVQLISEIRDGHLVTFVAVFVVTVFSFYFYFFAFPNIYRVLPFPSGDAIGTLDIRDPSLPEPVWKPWKEARGTLYVRRKMQVRLNFKKSDDDNAYLSIQLQDLREFEPDSFWEIDASGSGLGDDGLRLLSLFNTIHRLNLSNANISGSGLVGFQAETPVEILDLSGNPFENEWVPWVTQFSTLKSLNIYDTEIDDDGLVHLANQTQLRVLILPEEIGDNGIKHLRALNRLKSLDLSRRRISDRGLSFLSNLTSLQHLDLSATSISNGGLDFLVQLERLRSLNLSNTHLGDAEMASVANLPLLESLDLSGTRVSDDGLYALGPLERLTSLKLNNHHTLSRITDDALTALGGLSNLQELEISGADIGPDSLEKLASLNLRRLTVDHTKLRDQDVVELSSAAPSMDVSHTPLSTDIVRFGNDDDFGMVWVRPENQSDPRSWIPYARAQNQLRMPKTPQFHVHLSRNGLENLGALFQTLGAENVIGLTFPRRLFDIEIPKFDALGDAPNIEEIHVSEGEIPRTLIVQFAGMTQLKTLDLGKATISQDNFALLPNLPALQEMKLGSLSLQQSTWNLLARFPTLQRLKVDATSVVLPTTETLRALQNIQTLDLRSTSIPDASIAALRDNLPNTDVLHYSQATEQLTFPDSISLGQLWVRPRDAVETIPWKNLGQAKGGVSVPTGSQVRLDVDVSALATSDGFSVTLANAIHTLHLVGGQTTNDILAQIARLDSLEVLDLFAASITDEGIQILVGGADALASNSLPNLHTLTLSSTSITDKAVNHLSKLTALKAVDLAGTHITDKSVVDLIELPVLERLSIENTNISRTGYRNLVAAMPSTDITFPLTIPRAGLERSPSQRIVSIESETPVGALYTRHWKSNDDDAWEFLAPLFQNVPIPAGQSVKLELSANDFHVYDALHTLPPRVLHTLKFAKDTRITRSMLEALATQRSIKTLILDETIVEKGALAPVAELGALTLLSLNRAVMETDELRHLRNVPWLENLDISRTDLSDESLVHLASTRSLHTLDAHGNEHVTDLGAAYLTAHPSVANLDLRESNVTDISIDRLVEKEQLRTLSVQGTPVTKKRVEQFRKQHDRVEVQYEKRHFDRHEIDEIHSLLQRRIRSESSFVDVDLPEILSIEKLDNLSLATLRSIQQICLDTLQRKGVEITSDIILALSGESSLRTIDPEALRPLQKMALDSMAQSNTRIGYEELSIITGVENFDDITGEERLDIQSMALSALMTTDRGIMRGDLPELENRTRFDDIPAQILPKLQAVAFQAMASSDTGLQANDLSIVAGVNSFDSVSGDYKIEVQDLALQAMANSETGIRTENIAALESVETFDAIDASDLRSIQQRAMTLIVQSDQGVTSRDMTELGGVAYYEDLPDDSMESLQHLALSTMVENNIIVTSENLSEVGGTDSFQDIPEERLDALQTLALSSMSNSEIGITTESMVELSGLNSFSEFTNELLEPMQLKALTAMADSTTGITLDNLATVLGTDDLDYVSDRRLATVRSRAVTAMAQSTSGIQAGQLELILGNGTLENLDLSYTNVVDADLLNIADLSKLRRLNLTGCTEITDNAIAYLSDAVNLEQLRLARTSISKAALASMWNLKSLRHLDLAYTPISDDALANLAFLPALETLDLEGTQVRGTGLTYIRKLPELSTLNISRTFVDDIGFENLPPNISLTQLVFNQTKVGDYSMTLISTFSNLEELEMAECNNISDIGFDKLRGLSGLTKLSMYGTTISDHHVESLTRFKSLKNLSVELATFDSDSFGILRTSLPNCRVRGVASLIPPMQMSVVAAPSLFFRVYETSGKVIFTTLLVGASFLFTVVPFSPMYVRYIFGFQEYTASGQFLHAIMTGAYVSGVVVNRSGRAFIYATRWLIFLSVAAITILVAVQFGIFVFDNYLALAPDR